MINNYTQNTVVNYSPEQNEELYKQCIDLHLPVSPYDDIETLKHYLQVAYDEIDSGERDKRLDFDLDLINDPIYIGRRRRSLLYLITKYIPFI